MNEFTKEELQILLLEMKIYIYKSEPLKAAKSYVELKDKLESMVDNYCEHEWENTCCQCSMDKIYCHKCDRTIIDDNQ